MNAFTSEVCPFRYQVQELFAADSPTNWNLSAIIGDMLNTGTLIHGGVMVNYRCNAACRHCSYSCSPAREPSGRGSSAAYMDEQSADTVCRLLYKGGCRSVHIGGGEPFLDIDGLLMVVRKLKSARIKLEYIETNAFWAVDLISPANRKKAKEYLSELLAAGADCLCISIDPFHAEYVPCGAPIALAEICEETGMNYFLWKQEFISMLSRLDPQKIHSRQEMEKVISPQYIYKTARLYGINYGGRAVNIERENGKLYPAEKFAAESSPCRNLLSTGHFHVDFDSYFIPPRCTGIRIPLAEAIDGIPPGKYPAFEALYSGGVSALLRLAHKHGFSPDKEGYPSECNLCFHLRHFLARQDGGGENLQRMRFPELDRNHYEEALR